MDNPRCAAPLREPRRRGLCGQRELPRAPARVAVPFAYLRRRDIRLAVRPARRGEQRPRRRVVFRRPVSSSPASDARGRWAATRGGSSATACGPHTSPSPIGRGPHHATPMKEAAGGRAAPPPNCSICAPADTPRRSISAAKPPEALARTSIPITSVTGATAAPHAEEIAL